MASSPSRKGSPRKTPLQDRRAAPGAARNSLQKLKNVLNRPIGVERHGAKLKMGLTERRRARPTGEAPSVALLCAELNARLVAHESNDEAQSMRHLVLVHDALERKGWPGIEDMSGLVLTKAIEQAMLLAREEPSPHLDLLIEGLRPLRAAAVLRQQREARMHEMRPGDNVEVSESDYATFEDVEQDWSAGTMPLGLVPSPERDD
jgi:hypothetical protein